MTPYRYSCHLSDGRVIFVSSNELLEENELYAYADHVEAYSKQYGFFQKLQAVLLNFDGNYVNIDYDTGNAQHFCRLRRITGYLVPNISNWNNGKRAELHDRKKHM